MRKPNPGDFIWDDVATATLKSLWLEGISGKEIGLQLGVSRSAVLGKLRRIDMLCRPRPKLPLPPARVLLKNTSNFEQPKKTPQKPRKRQNTRPLPPPEPYQAPPPPPLPPIGSFNLLDLRHGHCRWPCSDGFPPYKFCGAPQTSQSSYCETHFALAHNRGSQRDFDRAADAALGGKLFTSRAGVMQ